MESCHVHAHPIKSSNLVLPTYLPALKFMSCYGWTLNICPGASRLSTTPGSQNQQGYYRRTGGYSTVVRILYAMMIDCWQVSCTSYKLKREKTLFEGVLIDELGIFMNISFLLRNIMLKWFMKERLRASKGDVSSLDSRRRGAHTLWAKSLEAK